MYDEKGVHIYRKNDRRFHSTLGGPLREHIVFVASVCEW